MAIPRVQLADYGHGPRRGRDSPGKCIGLPGEATRERFSQETQLLKEMRSPSCRIPRPVEIESRRQKRTLPPISPDRFILPVVDSFAIAGLVPSRDANWGSLIE